MLDLHPEKLRELRCLLKSGQQSILVLGDDGIGKRTLVRRALTEDDELIEVQNITIDVVRDIQRLILRKSLRCRVFLLHGDTANVQVYNSLLKTLEEPPPTAVFIITAAKPPLPTVVSRCAVVLVPTLSIEELQQVLSIKGMGERAAAAVIPYANGSVTEAFRVYEKAEEKRRLIPFIKALQSRDLQFVLSQVKTISRADIELMRDLLQDLILARYGLVNPELANLLPITVDFASAVRRALLAGNSPSLGWLRAWFETESL